MENEINVPDMPFMREIFKMLRNGGFINEDCRDAGEKRLYRQLYDNYDAYFKYLYQLGYYLERENGYFYMSESRPAHAVQSKMDTDVRDFLPKLYILTKFNPSLGPGHQFKIYEMQRFFDEDDEMRSLLPPSNDGLLSSRISIFLQDLAKDGYIDISSDESTFIVKSAFRYLKESVLRYKLAGEHAKYNYEYVEEPVVEEKPVSADSAEQEEDLLINDNTQGEE